MLNKILLFGIALFTSLSVQAQVNIGDTFPDTTIRNLEGSEVTLPAVLNKPAVIVIFRGSWCSFCRAQLKKLNDAQAQFEALGYDLVAISHDKPEIGQIYRNKNSYNITFYSDSTSALSDALGISFKLDEETQTKYRGYGIDLIAATGTQDYKLPHPSLYILDENQTVQFVHTDPDYSNRLTPKEILLKINSLTATKNTKELVETP